MGTFGVCFLLQNGQGTIEGFLSCRAGLTLVPKSMPVLEKNFGVPRQVSHIQPHNHLTCLYNIGCMTVLTGTCAVLHLPEHMYRLHSS